LIRNVRQEFDRPNLPVVIGELGSRKAIAANQDWECRHKRVSILLMAYFEP